MSEADLIARNLWDADKDYRHQIANELARYRAAFSTPDEAERVSNALPETADGVKVVPGMRIYPLNSSGLETGLKAEILVWSREDEDFWEVEQVLGYCWYSTYEAAQQAKESE